MSLSETSIRCFLHKTCRWNQAAGDVLEHWRAKSMTLLKTDKVWLNVQPLMPQSFGCKRPDHAGTSETPRLAFYGA